MGVAAVEDKALSGVQKRLAVQVVKPGGGNEAVDFGEVAHGVLDRCFRAEVEGDGQDAPGLQKLGEALEREGLSDLGDVLKNAEGDDRVK